VFKQKAIEEALTLLKENGFEVPEPVAKNSKSRTSSEMLFGEPGSNKKRETKASGKEDDTKSMASSKYSLGSKTSSGNAVIKCPYCPYIAPSNDVNKHIKKKRCPSLKEKK
jgi:hypothetical protein